MLELFGSAKALLSPGFVEKVDPEALAAKLIKVEQDYGVKFEKIHSTFEITGQWHNVKAAHASLLQLQVEWKGSLESRLIHDNDHSSVNLQADISNKKPLPNDGGSDTKLLLAEGNKLCRKSKAKFKTKRTKIKGNPKRGRQLANRNNTNIVPEPVMIVQFQDQAFPDESCVDMEQVLDEFEKGQVSTGVKKEDLKKILEKNLEKMGRPSKKNKCLVIKTEAVSDVKEVDNHNVSLEDNIDQISLNSTNNARNPLEDIHGNQKQLNTDESEVLTYDGANPTRQTLSVPVKHGVAKGTDSMTVSSLNVQEPNALQQTSHFKVATVGSSDDAGLEKATECGTQSEASSEKIQQKPMTELQKDKKLRNIQKGKTLSKKTKLERISPKKEIKKKKRNSKTNEGSDVGRMEEKEDEKEKTEVIGTYKSDKDQSTVYRCKLCDYRGNNKKRYAEHMARVHGVIAKKSNASQEQSLFSCDQCHKSFVFGRDLKRHVKAVHSENRFQCDKCDKVYKSKYVFDKHVETHADGYVQPMFKCQLCNREFTTKFSLGCHTKSEHLGVNKTFICPTCGKSFKRIRSYREHANVHAGIRPYVCEICGKSFSYDKSLKEHRYMHDDVKRFPCTICDKAFRQRTCLIIHMKTHKNSKDHICSSCGKGFSQRQSLIRHERSHSGQKPYTCKLCSKSFSDQAVIRKHLLLSHKQNKTEWKQHVITEKREISEHYITGGPAYVKRDSFKSVQGKIDENNKNLYPNNPVVNNSESLINKQSERIEDSYTQSTTEIIVSQSSNALVNYENLSERPNCCNYSFDKAEVTPFSSPTDETMFHTYRKMNMSDLQYARENEQVGSGNNEQGFFIQNDNLKSLQNVKDIRYVLPNSNQIHIANPNTIPLVHADLQTHKTLSNTLSIDASQSLTVHSVSSQENRDVVVLNQSDQTANTLSGYQPTLQYLGSTATPISQLPHMEFWTRSFAKQN